MRLRIMHVIRSLEKGGGEKICLDICNELSLRDNVDVMLVSMNPTNHFPELTKNINYTVCNAFVRLSLTGKSEINTDSFLALVNDFKPHVIHSHLFWSELMSRESTLPKIKYVTHCHDNMVQFEPFSLKTLFSKKRFTQFYERLWILNKYKKCDNHFIAISKDTEAYFKKVLPVSLRKIKLLPNAINYSVYFDPKQKTIDRSQKIKLINIGRFAVYKNQQFLLYVIKRLLDEGIDVELTFLGDGPEKNNVEEQAKMMGLKNNVFFKGNVSNVSEILHQHHIYVHSSISEAFGLVLLEAMAAGLPVVALDAKGNRDIVINGQNGFLIDLPDSDCFTEKVVELIKTPFLYQQCSSFSKAFSATYDIKNYTDNLIEFYKEITR